MSQSQFNKLAKIYGKEKAFKALNYWLNQPAAFRSGIKTSKQAQFCIDNEYLWFPNVY